MSGTAVETMTFLEVLPATADKTSWSREQSALMTSLGLKGTRRRKRGNEWFDEEFEAPESIVQAFLQQCRTRRLDPFARQIYCIERGGKWGVEASIDGFRLQAERTGHYIGQTEPEWTDGTQTQVPLTHKGELVLVDGKPLMKQDYVWVNVWVSSTPPAAARIGILRDDFTEPMWGVASYAGYCPRDKDGNLRPTGQWQFNSANQLMKCAEMLGHRKAFPTELSGLYGAEEMDQAGSTSTPAVSTRPSGQGGLGRQTSAAVETPIVSPTASRDWAKLIEATESLDATAALYREADAAGELGLIVGLAGDKDDGSAFTVMDLFWGRKKALSEQTPPMVDVPKQRPQRRQWVREARGMKSREAVLALFREGLAAGIDQGVLDELEALARSLPDPADNVPESGDGWAQAESDAASAEWPVAPIGEGTAGALDETIVATVDDEQPF